jgi:two-component system, cell cycle sensor histidine kinase and response regulator CckA
LNSLLGSEARCRTPENVAVNLPEVEVQTDFVAAVGVAFGETGELGGSETILLVEDEVFLRNVTAEVLKSAGYRVLNARAAAEALEAFRKQSSAIQLLLADVVMPGMSGCELAVEIQALHPHIRVLFMSGHAERLGTGGLSCNQNCLPKPFTAHTLLKKIREVLDRDRLLRCQA